MDDFALVRRRGLLWGGEGEDGDLENPEGLATAGRAANSRTHGRMSTASPTRFPRRIAAVGRKSPFRSTIATVLRPPSRTRR
jgi:hypothetical protein